MVIVQELADQHHSFIEADEGTSHMPFLFDDLDINSKERLIDVTCRCQALFFLLLALDGNARSSQHFE